MLSQKLIISYSSQVLINLIQISATIVVARVAGSEVLGTLAFGLSYVAMFTFIADLGIGTAHIKKVSEGKNLGECITTYFHIKSILVLIYTLFILLFYITQKFVLHINFESHTHEIVIFIMLITTSINEFFLIPYSTFSGRTEQVKKDLPIFTRTLIHQILRIIIVLIGFREIALALGNLISTLLIIPILILLFKDYPRAKFDKKLAKEYIKIAIPVILIGISSKVLMFLDKVLLQFFTNSEQVGYYTAGYRIGAFVLLLANSLGALFLPLFSKAGVENDMEYIKAKINKFEQFSFVYIMPTVIILTIFSSVIVNFLLGEDYLPSGNIMKVINVAMFFMVMNIPYGNVITGLGYFKTAAWVNFVSFILYIPILISLTHPKILGLSGLGASIALLFHTILIGIIYRIFAKKHCTLLTNRRTILFVIYGICNYFITNFVFDQLPYQANIFCYVLFITIYFSITWLTLRVLDLMKATDWNYLKVLFDLKSIKEYISKELFKNNPKS